MHKHYSKPFKQQVDDILLLLSCPEQGMTSLVCVETNWAKLGQIAAQAQSQKHVQYHRQAHYVSAK
jgi:hypothetical protein